ncbi:limbic system-associated membrane protein isoform X3 [Antennarius striatus]|uniref:limbic system-associated membrane protein isoform X3 n=1 Tax=Antennarius striatus TaxID=241820 RepID=UPI0035B34223
MRARGSCWLHAALLRLLCLLPAGFPVRSDLPRSTDNITIRQGDTAVIRCYVDDKVSKVAWLNRSNIIFAGQDKWSLDPRVDLVTKGQLEYSLRIQKVDVYDEGSYTCSIQTMQQPKTSQVYLIVQVPALIMKVSEDVTVNEGSNLTLTCLASGRPDPSITWRLLNPSGRRAESSVSSSGAPSIIPTSHPAAVTGSRSALHLLQPPTAQQTRLRSVAAATATVVTAPQNSSRRRRQMTGGGGSASFSHLRKRRANTCETGTPPAAGSGLNRKFDPRSAPRRGRVHPRPICS